VRVVSELWARAWAKTEPHGSAPVLKERVVPLSRGCTCGRRCVFRERISFTGVDRWVLVPQVFVLGEENGGRIRRFVG